MQITVASKISRQFEMLILSVECGYPYSEMFKSLLVLTCRLHFLARFLDYLNMPAFSVEFGLSLF